MPTFICLTGTTPSTSSNTLIIEDSTLYGNYQIIGYSIRSTSGADVTYNEHVNHIYINSYGIYMAIDGDATIKSQTISVWLVKI